MEGLTGWKINIFTAFHRPLICKFASNLDFFFNKNPLFRLHLVYVAEKRGPHICFGEGEGSVECGQRPHFYIFWDPSLIYLL